MNNTNYFRDIFELITDYKKNCSINIFNSK